MNYTIMTADISTHMTEAESQSGLPMFGTKFLG
jgi:hypothetical protein